MVKRIRLGSAGNPVEYSGSSTGAPKFLREEDLGAYEYQGTRGVRIGEKTRKSWEKMPRITTFG